jgi:hypothetical protein
MRVISRAESWERVYEAFQQINFSAFDYITIKESLVDYLRLYFSEDFNDWIESSELLPIIEAFAYVGELLAYRLDLNAHENLLPVAQRKESILRLAKLLSYSAARNIPARGLVKLETISTTEDVFDSRGTNLSNTVIRWNDQNNNNWKEQFILVLNKAINQSFGTVLPSDRIQVQDILFERYELENNTLASNTLRYNITVSNEEYPMELVASELTDFGPQEKRPEKNLRLSILYLSDGLGDSSNNTGFFFFTKQGELNRILADFDGVTPNQTYDVLIDDCNETDVWVNNIDPDTEEIITDEDNIQANERIGEWTPVDLASAQNIIFNTAEDRNKYEVETLDNDNFRLIFGDGNFAEIPSGRFEIWYRTSANLGLTIPTSSIQNIASSFTYQDPNNKEQTFSFTFSLLDPIQNAAPSEDVERIRRVAPAVYYTQDRMVNGRDYNEFMLQDNSILKLRAINRTFAGDSKYIAWHDPKEYYENVKIFGSDLAIYINSIDESFSVTSSDLPPQNGNPDDDGIINGSTVGALVDNYIEPLLSTNDFFTTFVINGINPQNIRRQFSDAEYLEIKEQLSDATLASPSTVYLTYDVNADLWNTTSTEPFDWWISAEAMVDDNWQIRYMGENIIVHSDETRFWVTNDEERVITTDTLNTNLDEIVILSANLDAERDILGTNRTFNVIKQVVISEGLNAGTESINDLEVLPEDENGDVLPDNADLAFLIGSSDFVYFNRDNTQSPWIFQPVSDEVRLAYAQDQVDGTNLWKRERGREGLNFLWLHRTPRYHLIDPAPSNIIDIFIITRGYYNSVRQWLAGDLATPPQPPTSFNLRSDYDYLLENKMISDTVVLHPGKLKLIFGDLSDPTLQASINVIRSNAQNITANQLKTRIVDLVNEFFDVSLWEFGETFYFTELSAFIHSRLPVEVESIVLVPKFNNHVFGDLYQVLAKEDEIIQANITVDDIDIIESLSPQTIKQV